MDTNKVLFPNKNLNKFKSLSGDLKRNVFSYIPFSFQIKEIIRIDKTAFQALNASELYSHIQKKKVYYSNFIEFKKEAIEEIKENLKPFNLSEKLFYEILAIFMNLKYLQKQIAKESDSCIKEDIKNKKAFFLSLSDISFNKNPENLLILREMLSADNSIVKLDLSWNNLGDSYENMKLLCEMLSTNKSITDLNLSCNYIGNKIENIECLKNMLIENNTITHLDLDENLIGEIYENMQLLGEAISENKTITHLILTANSVGETIENIKILKEMMTKNQTILHLNLSDNCFFESQEVLENLKDMIFANHTLKFLNLRENGFGNNNQNFSNFVKEIKDAQKDFTLKF